MKIINLLIVVLGSFITASWMFMNVTYAFVPIGFPYIFPYLIAFICSFIIGVFIKDFKNALFSAISMSLLAMFFAFTLLSLPAFTGVLAETEVVYMEAIRQSLLHSLFAFPIFIVGVSIPFMMWIK